MVTSLYALYFVPLAILIAFGPYVARRYGVGAITTMMLTATLSIGLILAILGGQHRRNLTVASSAREMLVAGVFFMLLISVPTVSLVVLGRCGEPVFYALSTHLTWMQ